jgi:hypothetical protein
MNGSKQVIKQIGKYGKSFLKNHAGFLAFFAIFLVLTAVFYKDFGATWDETDCYRYGAALFGHYANQNSAEMILRNQEDESPITHCYIYPAMLYIFNKKPDIDLNHLLNTLFASILFLAAYAMLLRHWEGDARAALWGPLFIFLTPRLLGHFPFDPKDIPFAVVYFSSLGAIYALGGRNHGPGKILALGILFGLAQSLRFVGFSLLAIWAVYEISRRWDGRIRRASTWLELLFALFSVLGVSLFVTMLCWPYLGVNLFANLPDVFSYSVRFPWTEKVLYFGKNIDPSQLPWHYLPVWFLISTPLFLLFHFAAVFFKNARNSPLFLLLCLCLLVNFALYLLLNPTLYDGLRHYLFLMPVVCVLASMSFVEFLRLRNKSRTNKWVVAFSFLFMGLTVVQMATLHPYEYAYFNELTGGLKGADGRFETDYWGASYKEAVEWLKKNEWKDPNRQYKVHATANKMQSIVYFPPNVKFSELADADYFLSITRWNMHQRVQAEPLHVIKRQGVPLNYIYKLK